MFLVGLTGGIASGKSTVAKLFIENGVPVIDADSMARKVVEPGCKAWKLLKKEFGEEIFHEDGTLNREKLGQLIFGKRELRRKVNEITHPEIMKQMMWAAFKTGLQGHQFIILDIPLLYETGELVKLMHKIIVVNCTLEQQVERLVARSNLTHEEAKQRITAQLSLDTKCERADLVIDNSVSSEDTQLQVVKILAELQRSRFHIKIRLGIVAVITSLTLALGYVAFRYGM